MSDEPNINQPGPKPKKELSMEQRLLLAFALMGIVLFATPYLFKTPAPPAAPKKSTTAAQAQTAPSSAPPAATPAKADSTAKSKAERGAAQKAAASPKIAAETEQVYTIETDLYKVVFSNRGAVVQQWILKKYTDDNGKPLALVNETAVPKTGYPFTLVIDQKKPAVDVNAALFAAKPPMMAWRHLRIFRKARSPHGNLPL
jgi:YidC/Oxa1 family membrane protein insertase